MKEFIVNKKITINAQPAQVWDALTNPEKTKQFFFHSKVCSDWKVGSPITFKGKFFWIIKFEMKGEILQITPGKLLKYKLMNSNGSQSIVTDEITYENGKTILSVSDNVGQGEGAEKRFKRSEKGWDKILNGLKKFLEEKN